MDSRLTLEYDAEGDILYLRKCPAYAEQESEEIGDEVVARFNPLSGEIEGLEVLFSSRRTPAGPFDLPVFVHLRRI